MADTLIVYVDGFNLYHGLREKFGRKYLWLDLVALSRALRPTSTLAKVQYFTAPVLNDPPAASRQSTYLAGLASHNPAGLVDVVNGRYQSKSKMCRRCRNQWTEYEEKETDVNIATHIVADAARKSMDAALIVSADSDLTPAVRMARQIHPALFIAAAFPPKRFSSELQALMPGSFHIGISKIKQSQLPQQVVDPSTNKTWTRPSKWV